MCLGLLGGQAWVVPVQAVERNQRLSGVVFQAPQIAAPSSASAETLRLTPEEKDVFWRSPWVPVGMSFVLPGSGQVYAGIADGNWFGITRGVVYVGLLGVAWWQLFEGINAQDAGRVQVWSGVLVGVNVLGPVDAWVTELVRGQPQ